MLEWGGVNDGVFLVGVIVDLPGIGVVTGVLICDVRPAAIDDGEDVARRLRSVTSFRL